jgi:hypothetical protein
MLLRVPCLAPAEKKPESHQTPTRASLPLFVSAGIASVLHDMHGMTVKDDPHDDDQRATASALVSIRFRHGDTVWHYKGTEATIASE